MIGLILSLSYATTEASVSPLTSENPNQILAVENFGNKVRLGLVSIAVVGSLNALGFVGYAAGSPSLPSVPGLNCTNICAQQNTCSIS